MLLDIVSALLSFDVLSLATLILSNLHWVFIFAVLFHFLSNGKPLIPGMILLMFILFSVRSIVHTLLHWRLIVLAAPFFFVTFGVLILRIFIEKTKWAQQALPFTLAFIFVSTFAFNYLYAEV